MERKWTPGPWKIGNHYMSIVADGKTGHDEPESVRAYNGHLVCESVNPMNAHLIAAAPDLYEALEYMRDAGCPDCSGDCASANPPVAACPMKRACAALAKARGEA